MKKIFLLILIILVINIGIVNSLEATKVTETIKNEAQLITAFGTKDLLTIKNTVFKELKINDGAAKTATFTFDGTKIPTNTTLGITYKEICGKVNSYDIVIPKTCINKTTECYNTTNEKDNKTTTTCNEIITEYSCDEPIKDLKTISDYKITNVNITKGWCLINNTYYTYLIDWQPTINMNGNIIVDEKWAWWNATGGTITTILDGGINYTIHTFTSNGTFNISGTINATVLIVAGGGGGGRQGTISVNQAGGGGGAGGLIYNTSYNATGNIAVVVGNGGASNLSGYNSSFGVLVAAGGGRGGGGALNNGTAGGSGGGAGSTNMFGGTGLVGQGNSGGNTSQFSGGGGGGAGGSGSNSSDGGTYNSANGGNGGVGINYSINGSIVCYAGGGGGASHNVSTGGIATCGGGNGGEEGAGVAAIVNTGGGGGGGGGDSGVDAVGGAGGTGVVIVRYRTNPPPTVTLYFKDEATLGNFNLTSPDRMSMELYYGNGSSSTINITNATNPYTFFTYSTVSTIRFLEYYTTPNTVTAYRTRFTTTIFNVTDLMYATSLNATIWLIDLRTTDVILNTLQIFDLMQDYINPRVTVTKTINGNEEIITEDFADVEGKINAYLMAGAQYNIKIYSDNKPVRVVGRYYADIAGIKYLRLFDVVGVDLTTQYSPMNVTYSTNLVNATGTLMVWSQYEGPFVTNVIWSVYNNTITGGLLTTSTITNTSAVFTYSVPANITNTTTTDYFIRLNITVNCTGAPQACSSPIIYDRTLSVSSKVPMPATFDKPYTLKWIIFIFLLIIALSLNFKTANIGSLLLVGAAAFVMYLGWLPEVSFAIIGLGAVVALVGIFRKSSEK
jgi:hypothetical protein